MQRKFITNLAFLLFLNFLVKPFYILGIDAGILDRVGAETYGTYFALISLSFLLNIFLDLGINNFNTRAVSRNNQRAGEYLLNLMLLKIFLAFLYFIFTFLSAIN